MSSFRIIQDGRDVLVLVDGALTARIPWQKAVEISNALRSVASLAEEWDNALRIVRDQAVLMRAGAPIGFSNNPLIREEAWNSAQWDRDLRRYMKAPGAIQSKECFGRPSVTNKGSK